MRGLTNVANVYGSLEATADLIRVKEQVDFGLEFTTGLRLEL
jgi:hypothetical protein